MSFRNIQINMDHPQQVGITPCLQDPRLLVEFVESVQKLEEMVRVLLLVVIWSCYQTNRSTFL